MSRTKAVRILGRTVWVWDDSHDIVVARMVEAAEALGTIPTETLDHWRVWASVGDLAFEHGSDSEVHISDVIDVIAHAATAIETHGEVTKDDLTDWSVLDGHQVSGGLLRTDVLPMTALIDVVDGFAALLSQTLEPEPPGTTWWMLGAPNGRTAVTGRTDEPTATSDPPGAIELSPAGWCPCCGYRLGFAPYQHWTGVLPAGAMPPYENWLGGASYGICESCGFEFGFDDHPGAGAGDSFAEYRQRWIDAGCPWWFRKKSPPPGWDPWQQLKNAPRV